MDKIDCESCNHEFGEWIYWSNPYPTYFQSLNNEYKKCKKCGCIVFRYKPEGKEYRKEWTKKQREYIDLL